MQPGFITQTLFPLSTFVVMFGLGLWLTVDEFGRLARTPTAVMVGLVNQLLLLPLLAIGLALLLAPTPALAVGLVVLAASPGGIISNILVYAAQGDTALSITLTTLSSAVTFLVAPLWIGLALRLFVAEGAAVHLPALQLMTQIALLTLLPVALGMFVHYARPLLAARLRPIWHRLSPLVLMGIVAASVISERVNLPSYLAQAGLMALLLNLLATGVGGVSARGLGLPRPQAIAIALETGIQNAPVALTVSVTLLGSTAMSIPAATYAVLSVTTASLFALWVRRQPLPVPLASND